VKAMEVVADKTGKRMMVFLSKIVCFADRGNGLTEIHCIHRGVFKVRMPYDKFVDMMVHEKQLTYFTDEEYEDDTSP